MADTGGTGDAQGTGEDVPAGSAKYPPVEGGGGGDDEQDDEEQEDTGTNAKDGASKEGNYSLSKGAAAALSEGNGE